MIPMEHPRRRRYTIDRFLIDWYGKGLHLQISLNQFSEQGSRDNYASNNNFQNPKSAPANRSEKNLMKGRKIIQRMLYFVT